MSAIKPAKKIVVCKPSENVSKSGVVLATGEDGQRPETGVIIAIGEGKPPLSIKKGDEIVYRRYADNKIMVRGVEYNFVSFKDVVALIT